LRRGADTGVPGEKPLGAEKRTNNNKLNPHMTPGQGIKPGTLSWEASALTTAPSLLPYVASIWVGSSCLDCVISSRQESLSDQYLSVLVEFSI